MFFFHVSCIITFYCFLSPPLLPLISQNSSDSFTKRRSQALRIKESECYTERRGGDFSYSSVKKLPSDLKTFVLSTSCSDIGKVVHFLHELISKDVLRKLSPNYSKCRLQKVLRLEHPKTKDKTMVFPVIAQFLFPNVSIQ